jgi:hypothetical protein
MPNGDKWACSSSRHTEGGRQGYDGTWFGDALDIAAHEAGSSRLDLLVQERLWSPRRRSLEVAPLDIDGFLARRAQWHREVGQ